MAKRIFDLIMTSTGLVLLAPVLLVIALVILIASGRPIFHLSTRVGQHGKPFRMAKFRTMVPNAEKLGGISTSENDRRITSVGRVLRKYKMDELPQLLNVLKGNMSLVGPRPEFEEHTKLYSSEENAILEVKPGITDLASIHFRHLGRILNRDKEPDKYFAEKIRPEKNRLRLEYVRNRSFWLDLKILVVTLWTVLFPWGQENGISEVGKDGPGSEPSGVGRMGDRRAWLGKGR